MGLFSRRPPDTSPYEEEVLAAIEQCGSFKVQAGFVDGPEDTLLQLAFRKLLNEGKLIEARGKHYDTYTRSGNV